MNLDDVLTERQAIGEKIQKVVEDGIG